MMKKISIILIALGILLIGISSVLLVTNKNNNEPPKDDPSDKPKKEDKVEISGWTFKLPEGWEKSETTSTGMNVVFETTDKEGVTIYNGTVFNIHKSSETGYKNEALFNDTSFFKESLTFANSVNFLEEGQCIERGGKPVVFYPCQYKNSETSKVIMAYMPAGEDTFFDIQFYSNKVIDDVDQQFINNEDFLLLIDFLNSGVQK